MSDNNEFEKILYIEPDKQVINKIKKSEQFARFVGTCSLITTNFFTINDLKAKLKEIHVLIEERSIRYYLEFLSNLRFLKKTTSGGIVYEIMRNGNENILKKFQSVIAEKLST